MELVVEEELPVGSRIGDVHAIDEDEGDNAVIDYAIIGEFNRVLILYRGDSRPQAEVKHLVTVTT